jgi:hypothetical protein
MSKKSITTNYEAYYTYYGIVFSFPLRPRSYVRTLSLAPSFQSVFYFLDLEGHGSY